jgi:hypothetical protein
MSGSYVTNTIPGKINQKVSHIFSYIHDIIFLPKFPFKLNFCYSFNLPLLPPSPLHYIFQINIFHVIH